MTTLQLIIKKAKALRKAAPNKYSKWTDYVKAASATIKPKKKATVSGVKKKTAVKKTAVKKTAVKKTAVKKAAPKKTTSIHKDSKSHNVRINVVSGIGKGLVKRLDDIIDEIERRENVIDSIIRRKKSLIKANGLTWYNKTLRFARSIVNQLKKEKKRLVKLI